MALTNPLTFLAASLKAVHRRKDLHGTPAERYQLAAKLSVEIQGLLEAGYTSPWLPLNEPQALAYLSEADELFYGGAAGGGKSWCLLGLALTAHSRSLILRQQATQLQQLKDDLLPLVSEQDHWRNNGHGGILVTGDGRKIELSGCSSRLDADKYRGRAHDAKFFDEICHFTEETYRFVNAWLRTDVPGQRCRVVATGNPPYLPEEEWVIRYWAPWLDNQHPNPAEPGELRWFASIDGKDVELENGKPFYHKKERIQPRSRTFIPAKLSDNPILEATGYRAALQSLPEPLRSQLLFGDMSAGRQDDDRQIIPTRWAMASMRKWREEDAKNHDGSRKKMTGAGLDVAMGGSDNLCLTKKYDHWVDKQIVVEGHKLHTGGDIVQAVVPQLECSTMPIVVDVLATAGGAAVTALQQALPDASIVPCNFGEKSDYKDQSGLLGMTNVRAEGYWRAREALDPSKEHLGARLVLPDDRRLLAELCAARWKPQGGKVRVELKDEIRLRLGFSPDRADSLVLAVLSDSYVGNAWVTEQEQPKSSLDREPSGMQDYFKPSRIQKPSDVISHRDTPPADGGWIAFER